jgi:hypothetical protein
MRESPRSHEQTLPTPLPFLGQLTETFRDAGGGRVFAPLAAGMYLVSVQASAAHRWCAPREPVPPEEVSAWEVFVTDPDGRPVGPETHPWAFRRRAWVFHWLNSHPDDEVPVGRMVPGEVVQLLLDFLAAAARAPAAHEAGR